MKVHQISGSFPDQFKVPKGCMIEELIQALPSLSLFDTFTFRACGDYCLKECRYGFPHLVLSEWRNCLSNETRRNLSVPSSSTFVQVNIFVLVSSFETIMKKEASKVTSRGNGAGSEPLSFRIAKTFTQSTGPLSCLYFLSHGCQKDQTSLR